MDTPARPHWFRGFLRRKTGTMFWPRFRYSSQGKEANEHARGSAFRRNRRSPLLLYAARPRLDLARGLGGDAAARGAAPQDAELAPRPPAERPRGLNRLELRNPAREDRALRHEAPARRAVRDELRARGPPRAGDRAARG